MTVRPYHTRVYVDFTWCCMRGVHPRARAQACEARTANTHLEHDVRCPSATSSEITQELSRLDPLDTGLLGARRPGGRARLSLRITSPQVPLGLRIFDIPQRGGRPLLGCCSSIRCDSARCTVVRAVV